MDRDAGTDKQIGEEASLGFSSCVCSSGDSLTRRLSHPNREHRGDRISWPRPMCGAAAAFRPVSANLGPRSYDCLAGRFPRAITRFLLARDEEVVDRPVIRHWCSPFAPMMQSILRGEILHKAVPSRLWRYVRSWRTTCETSGRHKACRRKSWRIAQGLIEPTSAPLSAVGMQPLSTLLTGSPASLGWRLRIC